MALIDDVKGICGRLAGKGWQDLLRRHGLDLDAADLAAELARPLGGIDRSLPGFGDLTTAATRGIEPGRPAASLLYHAVASPNVHPTPNGEPAPAGAYPLLSDLDTIENYIYSLARLDLSSLTSPVVAVFAYQYRPATSGAHIWHADLAFSRTGVARVGTGPDAYDGASRSFRSDLPGRTDIAVTPARYAAFIAELRRPVNLDPIMGRRDKKDPARLFMFPVHKLFPGVECIPGRTVTLDFREFHRNEKLRRVHQAGGIQVTPGFDIDQPPFVRDSLNGGGLVALRREGASFLVVPNPRSVLVRTVTQRNAASGRDEIVRFIVPPQTDANRFSTSLDIPPAPGDPARRSPEYVNIRHRVENEDRGLRIFDMKALPDAEFTQALRAGNYEAAHFADETCDGAVVADADGIGNLRSVCAYSLVTAPDFFPLADQMEIVNWVREDMVNHEQQFKQGAPWPLCEGREPANLELPRPGDPTRNAFDRSDETVVAVVASRPLSRNEQSPARQKRFSSFLPDAASNVFAPGWDVSLGRDNQGTYYASYGLGSPFPEDSKLCAALNSFWPAVAPDASRTFRIRGAPTAMPLLDDELGLHPDHPRVKSGEGVSHPGWDGEFGPFFERVAGSDVVNAARLDRSDYVSNTLAGQLLPRVTAGIDAAELIRRMSALQRCIAALPPANDVVSTTDLWLVTAEAVADWGTARDRADPVLVGPGYRYLFAAVNDAALGSGDDANRRRFPVLSRFDCQLTASVLFHNRDGGGWTRVDPTDSV